MFMSFLDSVISGSTFGLHFGLFTFNFVTGFLLLLMKSHCGNPSHIKYFKTNYGSFLENEDKP